MQLVLARSLYRNSIACFYYTLRLASIGFHTIKLDIPLVADTGLISKFGFSFQDGRRSFHNSGVSSSVLGDLLARNTQQQATIESLLREKEKEKEQVLREKEQVLREKEKEKERLLRENIDSLREKYALKLEATILRQQLASAADKYMELTNSRNVRGALEYAASIISPKLGTDKALKELRTNIDYSEDFGYKLKFIAEEHGLRQKDILQCFDQLYHTYSKAMHGSEKHVYIRQADAPPTESAAVALVFEVVGVPYCVVTKDGVELLESPYRCSCPMAVDGLDVTNTSYMHQFGFLAANADSFAQRLDVGPALATSKTARLGQAEQEVAQEASQRRKLLHKAAKGKDSAKAALKAGLPTMAQQPPTLLGCVSEAFGDALDSYLESNPDRLLAGKDKGKDKGRGRGEGSVQASEFEQLMQLKYMRSLVAAGEAVGVLAAQSVGEPSTQMTLNTFHMAGRGEANVTLGIPRLREILMTAAVRIKTPVMTLPLLACKDVRDARVVANRMRRLRLAECLAGITVEETPVARLASGSYGRLYLIRMQFHPESRYPEEAQLSFEELAQCFTAAFCPLLKEEIKRQSRKKGAGVGKLDMTILGNDEEGGAGAAAGNEEDEADGGAAAAARSRKKSAKADDFEEEEDDEEMVEGKRTYAGGRGEQATYEGPDDEDMEAVAQTEKQGRKDNGSDDEEGQQQGPAAAKAGKRGVGKAAAAAAGAGISSKIDKSRCTCEVQLSMELSSPKLLMLEVAEKVAAQAMVRATAGIDRCYVIESQRGEPTKVQTDGINFPDVWANQDILDVDALTTNDVTAMLRTYGVEAARATILRECRSVFGAYGIGVDVRHLSLISDFMTHQGGYRPLNRIGIESSASPLLKMSFETTAHFLTDASLRGSADNMKSPAARICVGRVVELGTGCVEVMQRL